MFTKSARVFLLRVQVTCAYLRNFNKIWYWNTLSRLKRFSEQQYKFINTQYFMWPKRTDGCHCGCPSKGKSNANWLNKRQVKRSWWKPKGFPCWRWDLKLRICLWHHFAGILKRNGSEAFEILTKYMTNSVKCILPPSLFASFISFDNYKLVYVVVFYQQLKNVQYLEAFYSLCP